MSRDNKRKNVQEHDRTVEKKQRRQQTPEKQEDVEKQRGLQNILFQQRDDYDIEEKVEDFEHLVDYYEAIESIEQQQVIEFEKMEQLETEQCQDGDDDDYVELFKQIALLEEEEIQEREEQEYNALQKQLEQLEKDEKLRQLEQAEYYRWLEDTQQQQQSKQESISIDNNNTCPEQLYTTFLTPSNNFENGFIQTIDANHSVCEMVDLIRETGQEIDQQRLQEELSSRVFPVRLVDIIEEYDQSIELIIQSMDEEFNEDDLILTDNDQRMREQFEKIYIWFLNAYCFPKKEWPIVFLDQKCNIHLIRHQLKLRHRLLLETDHDNRFYICQSNEMKGKIAEQMNRTDLHLLIQDLNHTETDYVEYRLHDIQQQLMTKLDDLLKRKYITEYHFQQMQPDPTRVRLDFLSFHPDTRHKNGIPFRAKMTSCLGPTMALTRFLATILQPLYDQVTQSMTFSRGVHAVDAVELYAKNGFLRSTTLYATFYVDDIYTIFLHEETLSLLERFLNEYVPERHIQGIPIERILDLVIFFLQNQYFVYKNNVYRQIKGSGSGSPLSALLININLFYRQQDLVNHLFSKSEIFGRCMNEAFMTWNGSQNELYDLFQMMSSNKQSFLPLRFSISKKVRFLEVELGHSFGEIDNKVNHESLDYPFAFIPKHNDPIQKKILLVQTVLDRAVRCCSNRCSYNNEQRYLDFMFNKYDISLAAIINSMDNLSYRYLYYDLSKYGEKDDYDSYRLRIQTIQKEHEDKNQQDKWVLNCPLKGQQLMQLKEDFYHLLEYCVENSIDLKKMNIEIIGRPNYPANTK